MGLKDNIIPNKQITASSIYRTWGLSSFSWYPYYARLDQQGKFNAWTAESNSASEWLQVGEASGVQTWGQLGLGGAARALTSARSRLLCSTRGGF